MKIDSSIEVFEMLITDRMENIEHEVVQKQGTHITKCYGLIQHSHAYKNCAALHPKPLSQYFLAALIYASSFVQPQAGSRRVQLLIIIC